MESSSVTYFEDIYTLQGTTERCGCSEDLIRQIQKHGLMQPEIVKFGSAEIEIYSTLDRNICRRVNEALESYDSLSQAIAAAQEHVVSVYRIAHGDESIQMNDSDDSKPVQRGLQRKKLCVKNELLEAVGISEEQFSEISQHMQFAPLRLLIPGKVIEYYAEDDYLRLRYILTLVGQGCPLKKAVRVAYDWGMSELW
jgi:hypothetical protein